MIWSRIAYLGYFLSCVQSCVPAAPRAIVSPRTFQYDESHGVGTRYTHQGREGAVPWRERWTLGVPSRGRRQCAGNEWYRVGMIAGQVSGGHHESQAPPNLVHALAVQAEAAMSRPSGAEPHFEPLRNGGG